ncbi:DUF2306 domain-containing protein [Isoptericola halotolerans]|uniref:DUF2306 domain-containing protein n=1 Tax=Isoptericola halotolerans TaxID=300560 RepID=UPI00388F48A4
MNPPAPAAVTDRRRAWSLTVTSLAIAAIAVTPYLTTSLDALAAEDSGLARGYVDEPVVILIAFYTHVMAGGTALLLSPWQLWPGLRRRRPGLHRWSGRVILSAIAVAGLSGLVLAPVNQAGAVGTLGFGALGVLWLWTSWQGYRAIRAHDVEQHREWMTRAFALTFAAVTLRVWTGALVGAQELALGESFDAETAFVRSYAWVPFLCWVPNLVVAEWLVRRRRRRGHAEPDRSHAAPPADEAAATTRT